MADEDDDVLVDADDDALSEHEYELNEDLGDNGGHLLLDTADEFEPWIVKEQEFWAWLNEHEVRSVNPLSSVAQHVTNHLDALKAYTEAWKATVSPENNLNQIHSVLEQYRSWALLHSGTPEAKFIEKIRQDVGEIEAASALAQCIFHAVNLNDHRQFHGAVAFILFSQSAAPKTTAAIRRSLKELADQYSARHAEAVTTHETLRTNLQRLVDDYSALIERGNNGMADAVKLAHEHANTQRNEVAERLGNLEETYNAKLALGAPVTFWGKKTTKHRWLATIFAVAFIGYIGIATSFVTYTIYDTALVTPEFWQKASIGISGLLFISVGILIALARVLLRLTMSHLHLSNDADERVTMVSTYLALRQGGHADEKHMEIVLERLFAPAADGIVKEDLGAVTLGDTVKSALTRR